MEKKGLHTNMDIVQRSKGVSVVAKAAYNAREKITDERYGRHYDYIKKTDLVFSEVFLPDHIPIKYKYRSLLWNEIERIEKARDSQLARNLLFALPRELTDEEQQKLLKEFIKTNFTDKGMIADCNVHKPMASDKKENPHAHILLTLREMDEQGKWKAKSKKEYILDENGEKIKLPSGNYKSRKINLNDWSDKDKAKEWRQSFENYCNEYLKNKNLDVRIDLRSFKEQGREEEP